jgi:predicted XRE-type DNA-binding protein
MIKQKANIHYLYKTTCIITGRWYIGMHSTNNLEDGYMGSGKRLRHSLRYHGKNNHVKEILEFFDNRELLVEAEIKAITPEMVSNRNRMNLKEGGYGGGGFWSDEHMMKCSKAGNKAFKEKLATDKAFREAKSIKSSENTKKGMAEGKIKPIDYSWLGKKHSEKTIKLLCEVKKGTGTCEDNSQFGTCWITKDGLNKKIKKDDLGSHLNEGWVKGRFTEIKGEMVNNSKLTNNDVIEIKKLLAMNELSQGKIGKLFNVTQETISKINRKLIWR